MGDYLFRKLGVVEDRRQLRRPSPRR